MQEAKHTPGPWRWGVWDGDLDVIEIYAAEKTAVGSDKIDIAAINQNEPTVLEEWQIANARLIASAPELLEALVDARAELHKEADYRKQDLSLSVSQAIHRIDAAIAKATALESGAA